MREGGLAALTYLQSALVPQADVLPASAALRPHPNAPRRSPSTTNSASS